MPIVRTYVCEDCFHRMEVTLEGSQWNAEPPQCPRCNEVNQMRQEFRPVAIGGSNIGKATKIAETIAEQDYHVADMQVDGREGGKPKVRYKDQKMSFPPSTWSSVPPAALEQAIANGRQTRLNFGSGLDVLQSNIKNGIEPDLIANSKRRAALKVW